MDARRLADRVLKHRALNHQALLCSDYSEATQLAHVPSVEIAALRAEGTPTFLMRSRNATRGNRGRRPDHRDKWFHPHFPASDCAGKADIWAQRRISASSSACKFLREPLHSVEYRPESAALIEFRSASSRIRRPPAKERSPFHDIVENGASPPFEDAPKNSSREFSVAAADCLACSAAAVARSQMPAPAIVGDRGSTRSSTRAARQLRAGIH